MGMPAENGTVVEQMLECETSRRLLRELRWLACVPLRLTNGVLRYE